jgi:predicted PurR-regulated permease PerM
MPRDAALAASEPDPLVIRMPVDVRSAALTVLAVIAVILMLQYAQAMIIPIVLGLLISYLLEPIVTTMGRGHLPRPLASAIVLVILVAAIGSLVYGLRSEAASLLEQLPHAARKIRTAFEIEQPRAGTAIEQVQRAATELEKATNTAAPPPTGVTRVRVEPAPIDVSGYLMWGSLGLAAAGGQLALILFLAYFLLASGDLYRRKMVKIVGPSLTKKKITLQILEQIDHQIEAFLLVQLFTSIIVAVASWLVFRWAGLEQAALWGLLAGIFNSIPYFGPFIVAAGVSVVAFAQFGTIHAMTLIGGLSLVITSLEGFLLTPWLTSRAARMNAVAVFIGLLFWGWVWNVWGLLLAVPMLMVLKAVCDHVEDLQGVGELLGN